MQPKMNNEADHGQEGMSGLENIPVNKMITESRITENRNLQGS